MTNTDGSEAKRDITVALETELAEVAQTSVAAAAKAAQDRDIASIMGKVMTVMIESNMRMRRSHTVTGEDCVWWTAIVDYLTRTDNRQAPAAPAGKQRQN